MKNPNKVMFFVLLLLTLSFSAKAQDIETPTISHESGFYDEEFDVTIYHSDPNVTILYTLDGSEPNINNLTGKEWHYKMEYPKNPGDPVGDLLSDTIWTYEYSTSLHIADRTNQPNKVSNITISVYDDNYLTNKPQDSDVFKGVVLRVIAYSNGEYSEILTRNYFISPKGAERYSIPVLAINTDNDRLFGYEEGILTLGKEFDDWRGDNPNESFESNTPTNYNLKGSETEQVINFSYFENGVEVLNQGAGLRLNGNYSRIYPNKSYRFYAKKGYGKKEFKHNFFENSNENKFKRLIGRNAGNDAEQSFFRDAFLQDLNRNLNIDIQESSLTAVFINGEYDGLRNLRERYDTKYFEQYYDIQEDSLDLLENDIGFYGSVKEGDRTFYNAMAYYFKNNSMVSDKNYQTAITYIDPINYTDYFASMIYTGNPDWIYNNVLFWRKRVSYNPNAAYGNDGRFRFVLKDIDHGFNQNQYWDILSTSGPWIKSLEWAVTGDEEGSLFFRRLLENETYKRYFITRFADILNTTLKEERIISLLDKYKSQYQPEIEENSKRYPGFVANENTWIGLLDTLYNFANLRTNFQREQIVEQFNLNGMYELTLNVSDASHGYIHINTIDILPSTDGVGENAYPWTGTYFDGNPITIQAIPKKGFKFSHWENEGKGNTTIQTITLNLSGATSIIAHFIPDENSSIGNIETSNIFVYPNPFPDFDTGTPKTRSRIK